MKKKLLIATFAISSIIGLNQLVHAQPQMGPEELTINQQSNGYVDCPARAQIFVDRIKAAAGPVSDIVIKELYDNYFNNCMCAQYKINCE